MHAFPAEVKQSNALPSCFNSHTVSKCFSSLFRATFFTFLCFVLVISLFKIAPTWSSAVLASVPEGKKAVMYLAEKTRVLDKLCSGMSYSAVGREFNINESMYNK